MGQLLFVASVSDNRCESPSRTIDDGCLASATDPVGTLSQGDMPIYKSHDAPAPVPVSPEQICQDQKETDGAQQTEWWQQRTAVEEQQRILESRLTEARRKGRRLEVYSVKLKAIESRIAKVYYALIEPGNEEPGEREELVEMWQLLREQQTMLKLLIGKAEEARGLVEELQLEKDTLSRKIEEIGMVRIQPHGVGMVEKAREA